MITPDPTPQASRTAPRGDARSRGGAWLCSLAAVFSLSAVAPSAGADSHAVLDQDHSPSYNSFAPVNRDVDRAQTFTVGITGVLDRVEVRVSRREGTRLPLLVDVRETEGGVPFELDSPVLASASVPYSSVATPVAQFVSVDLSSAALHVRAGDVLALVLRSDSRISEEDTLDYGWVGNSNELYAGGYKFSRSCPPGAGCNSWLQWDDNDLIFRTYVPEPTRHLASISVLVSLAVLAGTKRRSNRRFLRP